MEKCVEKGIYRKTHLLDAGSRAWTKRLKKIVRGKKLGLELVDVNRDEMLVNNFSNKMEET